MHKSSFAAAALVVASMAATTTPSTAQETPSMYQRNVGHDLWSTSAMIFCSVPDDRNENRCDLLDPAAGFRITGLANGQDGSIYYQATIDDGRSGYVMASKLVDNSRTTNPTVVAAAAATNCKKYGNPRIGMSAKQVSLSCWGEPENVNRTETAGAIFDQYVYSNDRYVYLRNGAVTSIQTNGTLR